MFFLYLIPVILIYCSRRKKKRNSDLFEKGNLKKNPEIYSKTTGIYFESDKKLNLEPKQEATFSKKLPALFPDTKDLKIKISNREKIFKPSKDSSYSSEIIAHKLKKERKSAPWNNELSQSFSLPNRSQIYISDQKEQSIRDKIETLSKGAKKQKILFITYHISNFEKIFSNLLANKKLRLINPWMIKDLNKWEALILDNEIVFFDEFYLDPEGIFFAIVNLFLINHKIVFGFVNKKEFFSEAARKFKILFPDLAEPLFETKEILKEENESEKANFFN